MAIYSVHLLGRFPKLAGLLGLLGAAIACLLASNSAAALILLPKEPAIVELADLPEAVADREAIWVEVVSGQWDCPSLVHIDVGENTTTEVFLREGDILAIVKYPDERTCESLTLPVAGMAFPTSDRGFQYQVSQGRIAPATDRTKLFLLCTTCTRASSYGFILLALVMFPLGLGMYPFALWAKRYTDRRRSQPPSADLPGLPQAE